MGYTHYWKRPQIIESEAFQTIVDDLPKLVPIMESMGAPLANPWGCEQAQIGPEFIGFNGVRCSGHNTNEQIRLPRPANDAKGIGENEGVSGAFALPYRTCSGRCSYESLWFERCAKDGAMEAFCKTGFRPYDLAVTVFLVIAKRHLGAEIIVETDGDTSQWSDAFELCQRELGYGWEFCIKQEGTARKLTRL